MRHFYNFLFIICNSCEQLGGSNFVSKHPSAQYNKIKISCIECALSSFTFINVSLIFIFIPFQVCFYDLESNKNDNLHQLKKVYCCYWALQSCKGESC